MGVLTFAAPGAVNQDTMVTGNHLSNQFWGVWSRGNNPPTLSDNDTPQLRAAGADLRHGGVAAAPPGPQTLPRMKVENLDW